MTRVNEIAARLGAIGRAQTWRVKEHDAARAVVATCWTDIDAIYTPLAEFIAHCGGQDGDIAFLLAEVKRQSGKRHASARLTRKSSSGTSITMMARKRRFTPPITPTLLRHEKRLRACSALSARSGQTVIA